MAGNGGVNSTPVLVFSQAQRRIRFRSSSSSNALNTSEIWRTASRSSTGLLIIPSRLETIGREDRLHPGSILVDVLPNDHFQHSLIAQSPLRGLLAQLVDQVL